MPDPMFTYDEKVADLIFDYCRQRLSLDPVPLDFGGGRELVASVIDGLITEVGSDPETVLGVFAEQLAPAVVSCDSPRFLSFIPAAPTKASLLFDMVVSCSSLQGTSWLEAAGAVAAENQALAVLADLAGLPAGSGGCFVSGGSIGNLSALVVARDTAAERRGTAPDHPRIAVSEEAHSSVGNALRVIGVEPLLVPTDDHRLTGEAVRAALADDGAADEVVGVVATGGTTNAGIVDDLAGIGRLAAERSLWFHVDAAYGGAALFAPSVRPRFDGIELADSMIVDPHKWLFAPFDCAALLYRRPELARRVHTQSAGYLAVLHDEDEPPWNPSDYAFQLTRRARGLPLWFSLAVNGTAAYRHSVEAVLETARRSAELVRAAPQLELLREPELSVVLFRRLGWGWEDYQRWSARLLADQIGFVTPSLWEGETVGRLCFLHPHTTLEMVAEILATTA
ncbi:MAG: pyridoxal phosphate-dependent decarboxylase family protein [Acidimicrobiales bacterium]